MSFKLKFNTYYRAGFYKKKNWHLFIIFSKFYLIYFNIFLTGFESNLVFK